VLEVLTTGLLIVVIAVIAWFAFSTVIRLFKGEG
jgi:hypothetical protein